MVEEPTSVVALTLLLAALALKVTDLVKYLTNLASKDAGEKSNSINGLATFFLGWIVSVLLVWVLSLTEWSDEVTIGNESLETVGFWGLVVFGLVFTSVAGTLYDFKKAIDGSDSARKPSLIPDIKKSAE